MRKLIGEYGLRNKREVWRVKYSLALIRSAARELLTLEEKNPRRLFEGNALLRRLVRTGALSDDRMKLDYVLGLKSRTSWSAGCRRRCSSLDLPSLSTMHVSSSSRGTFASGSRLTSASSHLSEVAGPAALRGRTPRRVMTRVR